MKILKRLPMIIFIAFIGIMLLLFIFLPKKEYSPSEKRYLAEAPEFSSSSFFSGKFGEEFEKYLSDHTALRNFWVGLNSYYDYLSGNNGKNGYYLCKNGYIITDPCEKNKLETNLEVIKEFYNKTNIDTSLLVVPSTGYICDDILPNKHLTYNDDDIFTDITLSLENTNINLIDIRNRFKEEYKSEKQLYYKTDHHWTSLGAYTAYKELGDVFAFSPNRESSYNISSIDNFYGTAYSSSGYWFTKPDTLEVWDNNKNCEVTIIDGANTINNDSCFFKDNLDGDDQYTVFLDGNHPYTKIINPSSDNNNKLLIIKDSFAHCLTPFLVDHFKEITMIDMRYYKEKVSDLINKEDFNNLLYVYSIDNFCTDGDLAWLE